MDLHAFLSDHVAKSTQQRCFFHFTDRQNLESIKQHGLLSAAEAAKRGISIPVRGGNLWSQEADARVGLDRYVHLCLMNSHEMEYKARKEKRISDTVWIRVLCDIIKEDGVLATLEVSNKSGATRMLPSSALDKMDLEVIYTRTDWTDPAIKSRLKIARNYEILVPTSVPLRCIAF